MAIGCTLFLLVIILTLPIQFDDIQDTAELFALFVRDTIQWIVIQFTAQQNSEFDIISFDEIRVDRQLMQKIFL